MASNSTWTYYSADALNTWKNTYEYDDKLFRKLMVTINMKKQHSTSLLWHVESTLASFSGNK